MQITKDILIVGAGIAGAFLYRELSRTDTISVSWVDNSNFLSSSVLAAGITNPVTGKRATLVSDADILLQKRREWQQKDSLFARCFIEKNAFRPFKSIDEVNAWTVRSTNMPVTVHYTNPEPEYIHANLGGIEIHNAGYMHVNSFLQEAKKQGNCINTKINYSDISIEKHQVVWKKENMIFKHIIFCEGSQVKHNPYLSWLPIIPTKGEIIEIEVREPICTQFMYSTGIYIVPKTNNRYFVGATYIPEDTDASITEQGKNELLEKLNTFLKVPYQITGHWAGIRPATLDRIPLAGKHLKYENVWFINGLGSKGVFYAPLLADYLTKSILYNESFPPGFALYRKTLKFDVKNIFL
jgi:glycine/D-amino acid oxidase-like deaminating enzyme